MFSVEFRVVGQLAVIPTGKPFIGSDPKPAVSRSQQTSNSPARQTLLIWRLPFDAAHTVESLQAEFGADPQVTIGRLRNGVDRAFEKPLADRPCLVCVLIDVQGWIQAKADGHKTVSTLTGSDILDSSAVHLVTNYPSSAARRTSVIALIVDSAYYSRRLPVRASRFACYKRPSSPNSRVMEVVLRMYRLALFALVTIPLLAQTADLSGIISDPSGLPVPNATITVQKPRNRRYPRESPRTSKVYTASPHSRPALMTSPSKQPDSNPFIKKDSSWKWTSAQGWISAYPSGAPPKASRSRAAPSCSTRPMHP